MFPSPISGVSFKLDDFLVLRFIASTFPSPISGVSFKPGFGGGYRISIEFPSPISGVSFKQKISTKSMASKLVSVPYKRG